MDKLFDTTTEDIIKMTWDEIQDLISFMIRNKLYNNLLYNGCYGGKLLGAGNGGFIFMMINSC